MSEYINRSTEERKPLRMNLIRAVQNSHPLLLSTIVLFLIWTFPLLAFQQGVQPGDLSEAKLRTVARVYLDVFQVQQVYRPQIEAAQSQQEAQRLQQQSNREMTEIIEDEENLTVDEYSKIVSAAQQDQQLADRLDAYIREIQEERMQK